MSVIWVRVLVMVSTSIWLLLAAGCSRPGEQRCTEVCEHYLELYLASEWQDKLAKAVGPDARAALERQMAEERKALRTDETRGFETCVVRCNRRSRGSVADCVMQATTLDQAKECDGDEDSGCRATGSQDPAPLGTAFLAALGLLAVTHRRRRHPR